MRTIIGVFANHSYAQETMEELEKRGFSPEDISVIMKDSRVDAGVTTGHDYGSNVAKGAGSGVATGAILGGLTGLLVGIGALALPGIGAFLIGGPLAAALGLSGAAAATVTGATTGAVAGGLLGALTGLGLTREQAIAYEEQIKEGAVLMAVPVAEESEGDVRGILERFNATDITSVVVPSDRFRTKVTHHVADSQSAREDDAEELTPYAQQSYMTAGTKGGRSPIKRSDRLREDRLRKKRI